MNIFLFTALSTLPKNSGFIAQPLHYHATPFILTLFPFLSKAVFCLFLIDWTASRQNKKAIEKAFTQNKRKRGEKKAISPMWRLICWGESQNGARSACQVKQLSRLHSVRQPESWAVSVWHLFHFQIKYCFSKAWPIFPLYFYHLLNSDEQDSGFKAHIPNCLLQMFALEMCKEL